MSELVEDAKASGARVAAGGSKFSPNGKDGYLLRNTLVSFGKQNIRINLLDYRF